MKYCEYFSKKLMRTALLVIMIIGPLPISGHVIQLDYYTDSPQTASVGIHDKFDLQSISIPKVSLGDDGNFYSVKSSTEDAPSRGESSVKGFSRSFQISTSVSSVWTRTENFKVDVHVYLTGYLFADITITFEGFDNFPGPSETREVYEVQTVYVSGSHSVHTLWCYLPSTATVGLKRAQVLVSGQAYYKDVIYTPDSVDLKQATSYPGFKFDYVSRSQTWGYEFVARYGLTDLEMYGGLPPSDAMSSTSGNPSYYWEGIPEGGFNIFVLRALFRPMWWEIMYQAAYLVDNHISYPEYSVEVLLGSVHYLITYDSDDDTVKTTNADMLTYIYNWRGVCDEFTVVLCSFLRVLNIPCRYMIGSDAGYLGGAWRHAWAEAYVSGSWTHCDATMNLFNKPWYYAANLVTMDWVNIYSCGDDGRGDWDSYDGDSVNGKLDCYKDWYYCVSYDGPNNY